MENVLSIYGLIYIPLILSIVIQGKQNQIYVIWFWIVVLTLFSGLRWEVGTDWPWYEQSFYNVQWSDFYCFELNKMLDSGDNKILEQGWALLLVLVRTLFGYYTFFLLFTNFVILFLVYKTAIRVSDNPIIYFVLYINFQSFFPVRQHLAVAIMVYSFVLLFQKGRFHFFLGLIISFFIHNSSIALFPYLFVKKYPSISFKIYFIVVFVCLLFAIFFVRPLVESLGVVLGLIGGQMGNTVIGYIDNGPTGEEMWGAKKSVFASFVLYMFFLYSFFYFLKLRSFRDIKMVNFKNAIFISFTIFLILNYLFSNTIPVLTRMSSYFTFAMPMLAAMSFDRMSPLQRFYAYPIVIIFAFYRFLANLNTPWPEIFFPYKSIF